MTLSEQQRAFAEQHGVAHLATADAAGDPHVVPICYAVDADAFYFVVDEKRKSTKRLKRIRNLEQNPRAAIVIDDYDDAWERLAYLLVRGAAALVDDPAEYDRVVDILRRRYPPYRSMALDRSVNPMVRIEVEHAHLWRLRR